MRKATRLLSIILASTLALSLAACGGDSGTTTSTEGGTKTSSTAKKDDTKVASLKWLTTGDAAAKPIPSDDRIVAAINEKLGIKLSVQIVPEGNVEKVNVAMASGDFPDVVTGSYGTSATQKWIDDGAVIELNSYFDSTPSTKARLESEYDWTAIDGKYYGVPFITQFKSANALIPMRKDWLDKLNLEYPKTLEDMKAVLTAFTKNDPDGNGKDDTYGYTSSKPGNFDWVLLAYDNQYGDYSIDANDNVIPRFEAPAFKEGMTFVKELWDSGVIDPEVMLNDNPKKEEKFYQGRVGAMDAALFRNLSRHESNLQELFPEASIVYGLPPTGPNGQFGLSKQGKNGMFTCVTTACKTPDKATAFIDFMVSEEGNDLLRLGIEGIHYTKNGDKLEYNMEEREKDAFADNGWAHPLAWGSFFWPLESNYLPDTDPNIVRIRETTVLASEAQIPNLIKQKTPLEIKNGSALNDIYTQYFTDMLSGKVTIEEGISKLSASWRSQGGEDLLKEVNEIYKASK